MKAKKITALALASIMVVSTALTGCGGGSGSGDGGSSSSGSSGDVTEVTFWGLSTRQEAFDPMVEEFNSQHDDIHVTASYYDTDGMKDACKVAASSKTLPNMWFNWGGSLGSFYVDNGVTYDLTSYAQENNWSESFPAIQPATMFWEFIIGKIFLNSTELRCLLLSKNLNRFVLL